MHRFDQITAPQLAVKGGSQPVQFGKYLLVQRLGRGGMAEVWRSQIHGPAGFQRTLVVKRILPHLVEDPHFVKMFVDEARLSARLNHPNIVQVFELGDVQGEYFLAMEFVHGRDLINVVRAFLPRGAPPVGLGALVMRDTCRALGYAHSLCDEYGAPLRLIHRDVTPSNVMISFDGAVKLLDFGIAKALGETGDRTQTGTLKGKFGYMAPEQVEGREADHRADLFAAGVVLHEVLTGKRLFKGATDIQTIAKVRDARVAPPSHSNPEVPHELDRICMRALARDPDDRYRSGDEMAAELDQVVHDLKWGPDRLSVALRDLFPDEPSLNQMPVVEEEQLGQIPKSTLTRRRRRFRGVAVVAVLAVAGAAATWAFALRRHEVPVTPPPLVAAPIAAPVRAQPAPVDLPPPARVQLWVRSLPESSQVFVDQDKDPRGVTPLKIELPRGPKPRHITLRAAGYIDYSIDVVPDANNRVEVTLVPVPKREHPHASSSAHRASRPAAQPKPAAPVQKPAPDVAGGDLVTPFSH